MEKPFGRDLASAQELNRTLHRFFPEQAIFRIDHYLGKEPVQNLIYFRFANPLVEAGWNNKHIESVQITMAESFGVAGRGKFYEEAGAIRDVVQNHMLQVIACLAMECPSGNDHEARARRARAAAQGGPDARRRPTSCAASSAATGRSRAWPPTRRSRRSRPSVFTSTTSAGTACRFTCAWASACRSPRRKCWSGSSVPPRPVLDETGPPLANYYRFRLSPEVVLALGTKVKKPGERMVGERIELVAHHQPPDEMEPYERLLGDAANGDATLFAREDAVEAAWRDRGPGARRRDPALRVRAQHLGTARGRIGPRARRRLAQSRARRRCPHDATCPGRVSARRR